MPTSMIDGTVEDADVRTDRGGVKIFRSIRFRLADGSEHTVEKAVTTKAVGDELVPGASGRFYLFKAFDIKGVHAVRMADGRAVHGFPGNNQRIFLLAGIVAVLWNAILIATRESISLLAVAMIVLSVVGWYFTSKGKREAQAQFEGDSGYSPVGCA
ncbi:MAG TPA: hypothetical protein VL100_13500 [Croceibacterium sp.]|nr:hypothetical protein [Croceibacterium sp.]